MGDLRLKLAVNNGCNCYMSGCERNTFYWSFFLKCVFLRVNIVSNTSNMVKKAYIKVALFCLTEKQNFKGVSHVWIFVNWKYYCATIKLCPFVSTQVTFVSFLSWLSFSIIFSLHNLLFAAQFVSVFISKNGCTCMISFSNSFVSW